jgi:hypothetical protein
MQLDHIILLILSIGLLWVGIWFTRNLSRGRAWDKKARALRDEGTLTQEEYEAITDPEFKRGFVEGGDAEKIARGLSGEIDAAQESPHPPPAPRKGSGVAPGAFGGPSRKAGKAWRIKR